MILWLPSIYSCLIATRSWWSVPKQWRWRVRNHLEAEAGVVGRWYSRMGKCRVTILAEYRCCCAVLKFWTRGECGCECAWWGRCHRRRMHCSRAWTSAGVPHLLNAAPKAAQSRRNQRDGMVVVCVSVCPGRKTTLTRTFTPQIVGVLVSRALLDRLPSASSKPNRWRCTLSTAHDRRLASLLFVR
jgi:hypothetical protein